MTPGPSGPLAPDAVRLERLPVALVRALVDGGLQRPEGWDPGFPTADTFSAARMLLGAYDALGLDPTSSPWWVFAMVVGDRVVGDAGFHSPPADDGPAEVEIGYQVVPGARRRGVATRACGLLLEHAWRHGADVVRAEVEPGPYADASRAVLTANGFREVRAGATGGDPGSEVSRFVVERPVGPRT
ncbi:Acetyltransferase (GNAT) domain-containing protein [Microlunatus sagamiharensis]|uniref:Acetyltransferase (GNAT) domain-containing protein n=1 Tax=Microlunatus sagamiharensis TaxID=546874 RepID=A0A1H2N818_9ACTN|nr:GNAT family N-acetyltransferase [Microlunatus sagamiharensis]SDV01532.1 Acetyltransferase (GNAT) domain-containing protein [Microlunatus sagamiharensis]